jgi:O-antigen/teichoic acid export membrane protein
MLGRAVAWNVFGRFGVLGVGFVSSILVARWLGPADRGLLAVVTYTAEIVVAVAGIGLTYAVAFYVSRKDARYGAVLGNSLLYCAGLALVIVPTFVLLRDPLARLLSEHRGQVVWALGGLLVPLVFLEWCTQNQLFGRLRFGLYNAVVVSARLAYVALAVLLVGVAGYGVGGAVVASMGASATVIVASLAVVLRDARVSIDLRLLREMIGYGARVAVGWIFDMLNSRVDILMVQLLTGLTAVGYYVIAQVVAELTLAFASAIQASVLTLTARSEGEARQDETTISSLRHQTMLTTVAIALIAAGGPVLIHFGYGAAFDDAITPMLILLLGMLPLGAGAVVAGNLRGRGRPGTASAIAGATVCVTLLLDLLLIPFFGVHGAALASVGAYTFYGVVGVLTLSRLSGLPVRALVVPTAVEMEAYRRAGRRGWSAVRRRPPQ